MTISSPDSFRDPAGHLVRVGSRLLRLVREDVADEYRTLFASTWMRQLMEERRVIRSWIAPASGDVDVSASNLCLEHEVVPFPTYPTEWPLEMIAAAGELTLDLCDVALGEGAGLKDATPSNVLFRGPDPVFVDVLSFEKRTAGAVSWNAYGQFVRCFLLPVLLMARQGDFWRGTFLLKRDGIEPQQALRVLSALQSVSPSFFGTVTMPALLTRFAQRRTGQYQPRVLQNTEKAEFVLRTQYRHLRKKLRRAATPMGRSTWSEYIDTCSYSKAEFDGKSETVRRFLADVKPRRVLDVGCNTGHFAFMAAAAGAEVIAVDTDAVVVGRVWRRARELRADVLPLVVDLARPTPACGWRNAETRSFLERANGYFDCVLQLAVVHHLLVTDQVPLSAIVSLTAELTTRWAVVEFVGADDPQFVRIARGRDALFKWYTEEAFATAFRARFDIVNVIVEGAHRSLYILRRCHEP